MSFISWLGLFFKAIFEASPGSLKKMEILADRADL